MGAMKVAERSGDDILLWPCGTWTYAEYLYQYTHLSDDYERISVGSDRWTRLLDGEELT